VIQQFVHSLKRTPKGLFNPWFHRDIEHDTSRLAPEIRRKQLEMYLEERRDRAKYLFIAEALGYQGGHFTGIAMTSERILLGHQFANYGVKPSHVFKSEIPKRTSREKVNLLGMSEPTATIMWGTLINLGIDPYEVVLWNSVPWHPYNPKKGMLSNRTPLANEMLAGQKHLKNFLTLFPDSKVVAVGRKCEQSLSELEVKHIGVRHPANGGAPKFRAQLADLTAL